MTDALPIGRFPVPALADMPEDIRNRILAVQEKSGFIPNILLEFQQVVLEVFVSVPRSRQSAALKFGHQPIAHFRDVAPVESCIEQQETVTPDLFHNLLHHAGDVVDRPGEIDAGLSGLADGDFPRRLADPSGQR